MGSEAHSASKGSWKAEPVASPDMGGVALPGCGGGAWGSLAQWENSEEAGEREGETSPSAALSDWLRSCGAPRRRGGAWGGAARGAGPGRAPGGGATDVVVCCCWAVVVAVGREASQASAREESAQGLPAHGGGETGRLSWT